MKEFLSKFYEYDEKEHKMKTIDQEEVKVYPGSVSYSRGFPYFQPFKKAKIDDKRIFFFGYDDSVQHIKTAIDDVNTDYIVSCELLMTEGVLNGSNPTTLWQFDLKAIMSNAKAHPEVGIYRKRGYNKNGVGYNIVMIRVKENGNEVRKYMDAYLASSDSCTYHDVRYTIAQFKSSQSVSVQSKNSGDWPHNLLIFGAPGTGKSYSIDQKIKELGWQNNMRRVTFYEDYSYEKFVGAYLPCMGPKESNYKGNMNLNPIHIKGTTEKSIEYRFVPGVFLQMITDAWFDSHSESPTKYVLVIEEINRANAASVFGDFFQLLDRNSEGISEYYVSLPDEMREWLYTYLEDKGKRLNTSKEDFDNYMDWVNGWLDDFRLPGNLYLWATMNSADQGVYPMDAAFKRRWSYMYKSTMETSDYMLTIKWKKDKDIKADNYELEWDVLKTAINQIMENSVNIEEDRFVGPWYFKKTEIIQIKQFTLENQNNRAKTPDPLTNKLFQYLRQDVFRNNPTQIFKDGYLSMSKIREGMINGYGLNEILKLDGIKVNGEEIEKILKKYSGNDTGSTHAVENGSSVGEDDSSANDRDDSSFKDGDNSSSEDGDNSLSSEGGENSSEGGNN